MAFDRDDENIARQIANLTPAEHEAFELLLEVMRDAFNEGLDRR